ncbi:hypothetical protein ABT404_34690 [Streptomyces hyaluromycini]|uniref:Uncharacterized protein n=1 Tax=Streptomyces hyaluromycini TaxID=1377993 RepID=A0ABV1X6B4_9ACTN
MGDSGPGIRHGAAAAPPPAEERGAGRQPGPGRRSAALGVAVLALAGFAAGAVWLFRDDLPHPLGDKRACAGSDQRLPDRIVVHGTPIPSDASDVHYFTRNGRAVLSFRSGLLSDYLRGAGILPAGADLFDRRHGGVGVAGEPYKLPDGLCGPALQSPVWYYDSADGVRVTVERSPLYGDALRFPARAVLTYPLG